MKRSSFLSCVAIGAVLSGATFPARASLYAKVDIASLQRQSEFVVRAWVSASKSEWNKDRSMIFTFVTLEVEEALMGHPPGRIVVRIPGGKVDRVSVTSDGLPSFQVGDDVVVFVARWGDGVPMVAGYGQGESRVVSDSSGALQLQGGVPDGLSLSQLARRLRSGK